MSKKLNGLEEIIDELYYKLLEAQLDQDWKEADSIQRRINGLEKRESQMATDSTYIRNNERTV